MLERILSAAPVVQRAPLESTGDYCITPHRGTQAVV
ncbi:hypothetical protein CCHOA_07550 [Corynebacterium choanae]|uniref:Uncharacterized protein n=1 Tax=Corynebacterium choanae TaxID=1862358 RepID=A0A3G6J7V9_9CORY|nr:hypothetical protein CCHOA_07550 [Corynebacterium choanae]